MTRFLPGLAGALLLPFLAAGDGAALEIRDANIFTAERRALTRDYCRTHYGQADERLATPRMVVIHFTTLPTYAASFAFFAPLLNSRDDIAGGGAVNISVHYMVDKDGTIYRLAPDDVVCRHIIGFNHVSLGIENVGRNEVDLTEAQLEADAALVAELKTRYPTIDYLIGHHEYQDRSLPHFALHRELDPTYQPTRKNDPGPRYMERLRRLLKERYRLEFKA